MINRYVTFGALALAALGLAACVETESNAGSTAAATPTEAEQACLAAVSRETNNGDVVLLGSEFSQAGTFVRVGVGEQQAPWKCIAYSDGATDGIEYLGSNG